MFRFLGLALTAFVAATMLATSAGQALAHHVQCGDVIAQHTRLDSDLIGCLANGLTIGAGS